MKQLALLLITALLTGCATDDQVGSYTISRDDVKSIAITKESRFSVSRVVVLANGVAEIMKSLNAASIIVGRDISTAKESFPDITLVTSGHQVLPEQVIALKPDLVIIDASTGPPVALNQIRASGVEVVEVPESWSLEDIPVKIRAVSSAIGASSAGELLIAEFEKSISTIKLVNQPRVAFLYLRGSSSIYLIGGPGSGADSLLERLGAIDIGAANLPRPFNTLTAEKLAELNPDVILVMSKGLESVGGPSGLVKLAGVAQSNAGKNGAIIDVEDSLLLSFGTQSPSLLTALARALKEVYR